MADLQGKRKSFELLCKYGTQCYRKNPEHRKKYRHSDEEDETKKTYLKSEYEARKDVADSTYQEVVSLDSKKLNDKNENENSEDDKSDIFDDGSISEIKYSESVEKVLKIMPSDFFDFWDFCSSLNKLNPEEAFSEVGLHLVGIYDLLSKKISPSKIVNLHCHWRYYYDPPEFQTVVKADGKDLYHIGYFRDHPDELPSILAANSANIGPKLTLKGDNIFAAIDAELSEVMKKSKNQKLKKKFTGIKEKLKTFANEKKYCLDIQSPKTKARNKKVVAKTFHGLGIVVPVINDIGYRPLPDSDATVKAILKKIVSAENEDKRLHEEENLDELITNVQFANDECDYGMGLELAIDLFCYGHSYFHNHILHLLPLAYNLIKRPKYGEIIKAHLKNRKKSDDFDCLND